MSAPTLPDLFALDLSGTARVPFGRLVRVELRKMADTRAGLWLMIVTGGLLAVTAILTLVITLANDVELGFGDLVQILTIPLSLLLPVFAIMSVTSEWSQRTGLVTFALEPHRLRAILAKLVAVVGLALTTIAVAAVVGVAAYAVYAARSDGSSSWALDGRVVAWTLVSQILFFLMAFGFALVFLNTPAAIAIYYVIALLLPLMVFGPVMALVSWGPDVIPWIDLNTAIAPLATPDSAVSGEDYARVGVTTLIWVVLPIVLGLTRVGRAEIK